MNSMTLYTVSMPPGSPAKKKTKGNMTSYRIFLIKRIEKLISSSERTRLFFLLNFQEILSLSNKNTMRGYTDGLVDIFNI